MPKGSITAEFTSNTEVPPYDRLKLDTAEKARLAIPDMNLLWWEYVHTMRAPVLDEAGEPIPTQMPAGRNGQVRPGWAMSFVGAFKCYGRREVIEKNSIDPDMCPGCAASARGVRDMVPERRFAIPVIRYATTTKNSTQLRNPPNAAILIWAMGQKTYDKLLGQVKEIEDNRAELGIVAGAEIELRSADIVLECESGDFQRLIFKSPMRRAVDHPAVRAVIGPLWMTIENRPTDEQLAAAVVKAKDRRWAEVDVDDCEARWAAADRAKGGGAPPAAGTAGGPVSGGGLDSGLAELDALLTEPAAGDPFAVNGNGAAAAPAPPEPPAEDPFAAPAATAPAAAPAPEPPGGLDVFAAPVQDPPAAPSPVAGAAVPSPPAEVADPFAVSAPVPDAGAPVAANGRPGPASFEDVFKAAGTE